ncbi:MAG: phytanoyl-CoA dioxygenase family protein [Chitinophagales bacterium]|nr:phytanoyl-CoA dioxygenase family protein [Chitinophagales bacterium]
MLNTLKNIFNNKPSQSWSPIPHFVIKNNHIRDEVDSIGYSIPTRLDEHTLNQLRELYHETHKFNLQKGGMFYSVYSGDLNYRAKVHETIGSILKDTYNKLFDEYKIVLNSFIVKVNGPDSEFGLHQDSTGLDEMKFSPLSVWIPLQDTTIENGCLTVIPRSFKLFSPYRGISFPEPFQSVHDEARHYLQPINLMAGDVLIFDNRLVHYSPPNNSDAERIVVMSGIFPQEAKLISCYKDVTQKNHEIEIFEQADDYLLTFKNFFHDCTCRPETGELKEKVNWNIKALNKDEFTQLMKENEIPKLSISKLIAHHSSNIVSEPI